MYGGVGAAPLGAMDSLVVLAGLAKCPADLAQGLEDLGWNVTRLGTVEDGDQETLDEICLALRAKVGRMFAISDLEPLLDLARTTAEVAWRVEGKAPDADLMMAHAASMLQRKINEQRAAATAVAVRKIPRKGTAKVERWPSRYAKKMDEAGDNSALRDSVERNERLRWLGELKKILLEADCPAVQEGQQGGGNLLTRRVGKGRRVNTLRKHVKTWLRLRGWLKATFDEVWPSCAQHFAAYLEARAAEPCGKSVPGSVLKTLLFMESAGEIDDEEKIGNKAAVKNVVEEVNMVLEGAAPRFVKKAWHFPVALVVALEEAVLDVRLTPFSRGYAWFRLFKLWTGMRYSDTTGLDVSTLEWTEFGVTAVLKRTKTTDPGKKVSLLRVWMSTECWLREELWLLTGFEIWERMSRESGLERRDFFLPCPLPSMDGLLKRVASYSHATRFSQALFGEITTEYEGGRVRLLEMGVGTVWTEHSERATMRTWAEAAGISEEVRKQLGRWTPAPDQAYERTGRKNPLRAQQMIASFIKASWGRQDPFDEALVKAVVSEKMEELDYPAGAIQVQVEKLETFGKLPMPKRIKLTEAGAVEESMPPEWGPPRLKSTKEEEEKSSGEEDPYDGGEKIMGPEGPMQVPLGTYVLSVVGRGNRKTLHRVGECHRVPGVHYARFEVVGNEPPCTDLFHQSCSTCFPRGLAEGGEESSEDWNDEDVSSSDSSLSVEETDEDM
eukprot:Skav230575  [mRNA]  locus=scaffold971:157894:160071:- [translate_table: standard]